MLERTIRELRGEAAPEESEIQLNLALNIRIPNDYIPEENQRLRMYKRVAGVQGEPQLNEVRAELEDRYGPLPGAVRSLVDYAALRLLCQRVGAIGIERKRDQFNVRFHQNAKIDPEKLARFVATHKGAQFSPAGILKFFLKASGAGEVLPELHNLLAGLAIHEEALAEVEARSEEAKPA
jgi:transcription-repair coupling factor (superfamily II helicase)